MLGAKSPSVINPIKGNVMLTYDELIVTPVDEFITIFAGATVLTKDGRAAPVEAYLKSFGSIDEIEAIVRGDRLLYTPLS